MSDHARKNAGHDRASLPLRDRLIVALDLPTVEEARAMVEKLGDTVSFYKIGMQLQFAGGIDFAAELTAQGKKVFLDSKLLDIDQTITNAVANITKLGVHFLTIHGNGPVIKAAVKGRGDAALKLLSVTALTSLDAEDMKELGLTCSVQELVMQRTQKAIEAGADGVIASGEEATAIRKLAGDKLLIISPGIRPAGSDVHEQKRVMTPKSAIEAGADYLVVGRPITQNPDPKAAAESILEEIRAALA